MNTLELLRNREKELELELSLTKDAIRLFTTQHTVTLVMNAFQNQQNTEPHKRAYKSRNIEGGSVISKIIDCLNSNKRFLHKRQIEKFIGQEGVSPILAAAKKNGKVDLVSYQPGATKNQTVWGLKDWLDSEGQPKPEYMFDVDYVLAIK